ncbi:MAG: glycosyl transferase, partial [Bdellovibrionales bacterium CG22_combo_CG10-13_8_21_14_all_38_13]
MSSPKVSVILPVYNGEEYLDQAIKSVLFQSYKNLELIIVDDCSTDRSLEIAKTWVKDDR